MKKYSLYFLVMANLVPIFGVLFLDWSLFSVMFFYWLESAVVGMYNIAKMFKARVSLTESLDAPPNINRNLPGRLFMVGFFIVHFGSFMAVHRLFIFALFEPPDISFSTIVIGIAALAISHGVSYKLNYLNHKEYEKVPLSQQMFAPYKRIAIMHVTIILGGILVEFLGAPVAALVFLVVLKIAIDLLAHYKEHAGTGTFARDSILRVLKKTT